MVVRITQNILFLSDLRRDFAVREVVSIFVGISTEVAHSVELVKLRYDSGQAIISNCFYPEFVCQFVTQHTPVHEIGDFLDHRKSMSILANCI